MTLPPWDYLFLSFNSDNFPDIFHPTWIASLVLLRRPRRPVRRADARAAQAPAVRRPVGMAVVDGADHVQPDHHRVALRLRLHPRAADPGHRPGDARLDPLPALPADPARPRAAAGARALLHQAEVRRSRGDDPQEAAAAADDARSGAAGADRGERLDAHRDPTLRRRPPSTRWPAGHDRRDRPDHPRRRPRPDRRAGLRARRARSSRTSTPTRAGSSSSRAAAGSASATSAPGSPPARPSCGRPTCPSGRGPSTPRCA